MTHLHTLTWADFKKFEPCYDPQERYGDFSGTILDILKDKRIPAKDSIWAATRKGMLDDRTLRLFTCKCVREVWHLLTDERSRKAVEVAELYAVGEATDEELADRLREEKGVHVSRQTVNRAVNRMGYTRKKRRSLPQNAPRSG